MSLSAVRAAGSRLRTKNLSLVLLGLAVFTVGGFASSPRVAPGRGPIAAAAPSSPTTRAPVARRQASDSHKQAALDQDRALQAKNAADAARAQAIRAQLDGLATKLDGRGLGRKKRAKLRAQCNALTAELEAVDPRLVTVSPRIVNEMEPNDDAREATALDAQSDRMIVASGSISRPGDVDLYTFDAPAGARVWAYLDASASSLTATGSRDSVLRLLDRDGVAVLGEGDDGASGSNFGLKVGTVLASAVAGATVPETGHFFLEVRAFDPAATMDSYKLVFVVSTAQSQSETAGNETAGAATPLVRAGATDGVAAAAIERPGDVDVYSIQATSGRPVFVAVDGDPERTGVATDTTLELLDRDAGKVLLRTVASGEAAAGNALAIMPPATGTFYLRVSGGAPSVVGKYTLIGAVGSAPTAVNTIPIGPFCGDTAASNVTQNGSLQSDQTASTCATTSTCPGFSGPNTKYVSFPFTNDTGANACVTVNTTSTCTGNSRAVVAAYLGSFNPNNICTNYLGDPGNEIGSGTTVSFSVLVPAGAVFVIVVNAARPGNDCGTFCFTLDSVACTVSCPDNITVTTGPGSTQCGANVTFSVTSPCTTDAPTCTANGSPVTSGDFFPVGTTTVTCTLAGSQCSFSVTVNDNTPPALTCPAPISASANASCQAAVPNVLPNVTATDNCTPSGALMISQSPTAGTLVGVGVTTITVTATDATENTNTCTTTFTVTDTTAPSLTCPGNITMNAAEGSCSATVNYATPEASDNCGSASVSCTPPSGSSFQAGTTTVTCTATDQSNNQAQCTFTVTVNDTTPPMVTCPATINANASANACAATVNYTTPTATDNCSSASVSCTPPSGSSFPVGTTTVTCTATDTSNNQAQCTFSVIVHDVTAPSVTCPGNVDTNAPSGQCAATVNYTTPSATDNCGSASVSCMPASGSSFPVGTTTVTCTATDPSQNMAQCTFTVTVHDVTAPQITCPGNIVVQPPVGVCNPVVNYPTPEASDACSSVTVMCSPASGSMFPLGTTTVTCTATDASNNSASCMFTVTVSGPPFTITCPDDIVVAGGIPDLGVCGLSAVVNYPAPIITSSGCNGNVSVSCVPASGSTFPVGTTTVTCTATDQLQQTVMCSFTVTVNSDAVFGVCYVDDASGDTFREVVDPNSSLYGYWEYHVAATGELLCGIAEYVSYVPGHSLVSYDNDASNVWMDANVNFGAGTAVIDVTRFSPYHRFVLRDRNIYNDPPCQ